MAQITGYFRVNANDMKKYTFRFMFENNGFEEVNILPLMQYARVWDYSARKPISVISLGWLSFTLLIIIKKQF